MSKFGNWIEEKLREERWKPADLARAANITESTISRIINQNAKVGSDVAKNIAKAFNESPEKVFRLAGLLPPLPAGEDDVTLRDLIELAKRLPRGERLELLKYAEFRYRRYNDELDSGGDGKTLPASADA